MIMSSLVFYFLSNVVMELSWHTIRFICFQFLFFPVPILIDFIFWVWRTLTWSQKSKLIKKAYSEIQLPPYPCYSISPPFVGNQLVCFLGYPSFVRFCNDQQMHIYFLIFPSSLLKSTTLCILFPLCFFHLKVTSINHATSVHRELPHFL